MDLFNRVLGEIKENKINRLKGNFNCIPWSLSRFSSILPGIQKARLYSITASSKIGKTQLTDFLFVYEPFFFTRLNDTNIKLKIFYFSLEVSKEEKIKQAISHKLYRDTMKVLDPQKMDSLYSNYILEDSVEKEIEGYETFFKDFESVVTYIDEIRNPFGIYKYMRDYANSHGCYIDKEGVVIPSELIEKGDIDSVKRLDRYIPNDPDEYVIVITDHVSLLTPEVVDGKRQTLHEAMGKFSSDYCLKMRNRFGYTVVNIQQQAADKEKQQYTYKGDSIEDKLCPSQDGLGDNKLLGRDCDIMLGLFAPYRYNIEKWDGYDIRRLEDNFRELSIILNRRGSGFISVPLYFNGAVNFFKELPPVSEMTSEMYEKILKVTK